MRNSTRSRPGGGAEAVTVDHQALVQHALAVLPGHLVANRAYEDFRRDLFALYRDAWGHLPQIERLQEGLRNAYRGAATHGHPWWWQVAAEIEAALERL